MIRERFSVILDSFRRKFRDKVPNGGRAVGREAGDERSERRSNSPANLSGGVKADDRYSIRPSGTFAVSEDGGSEGGRTLIT